MIILKANPEMLLKLLKEFNIDPNDALMVGDTNFDVIMAKNANVSSIAVTWGYHSGRKINFF